MSVDMTTTFTITLTQNQALDFVQELYEAEAFIKDSPTAGNTTTGLWVLRSIRDELVKRGIGKMA